ncbi:MAG: hypothetical protein ABIL39_03275 [candidate division WOR-3 bacterium]
MVKFIEKSGESFEEAIVILDASNHLEGVNAEYQYLAKRFGAQGRDWRLLTQSLIPHGRRQYDKIEIEFADQTKKAIFFDITSFFDKF